MPTSASTRPRTRTSDREVENTTILTVVALHMPRQPFLHLMVRPLLLLPRLSCHSTERMERALPLRLLALHQTQLAVRAHLLRSHSNGACRSWWRIASVQTFPSPSVCA